MGTGYYGHACDMMHMNMLSFLRRGTTLICGQIGCCAHTHTQTHMSIGVCPRKAHTHTHAAIFRQKCHLSQAVAWHVTLVSRKGRWSPRVTQMAEATALHPQFNVIHRKPCVCVCVCVRVRVCACVCVSSIDVLVTLYLL